MLVGDDLPIRDRFVALIESGGDGDRCVAGGEGEAYLREERELFDNDDTDDTEDMSTDMFRLPDEVSVGRVSARLSGGCVGGGGSEAVAPRAPSGNSPPKLAKSVVRSGVG